MSAPVPPARLLFTQNSSQAHATSPGANQITPRTRPSRSQKIKIIETLSPDLVVLVLLPALGRRAPGLRHGRLPHGQQLVNAVRDLESRPRRFLPQPRSRRWPTHHDLPRPCPLPRFDLLRLVKDREPASTVCGTSSNVGLDSGGGAPTPRAAAKRRVLVGRSVRLLDRELTRFFSSLSPACPGIFAPQSKECVRQTRNTGPRHTKKKKKKLCRESAPLLREIDKSQQQQAAGGRSGSRSRRKEATHLTR